MILSNLNIHSALDNGWLKITPEPKPRKPTEGTECPYQTSSVDLRLGNEIAFLKSGLPINIDLRRGSFADLFGPNSVSREISSDNPYSLASNQFVLGRTLERVELPIIADGKGPCLAARVEGKSSYARCGLLVHFTAPTIHSGYAGTITLELINFGPIPISLFPGAPICQLIIEQVDGIPFRNDSQFQGQNRPGGATK
jgi:dCTP deaminase